MRKFLKEIGAFSVIPLVCIVACISFVAYTSSTIEYKMDARITDLVIGDSHTQCAINDDLASNWKNVSERSESFYFSYYKLEGLIEENPSIERVYLGFSYHSLSEYYDKFIDGEYSAGVSSKYFYMLPVKEKLKLIYWNVDRLPAMCGGIFSESAKLLFVHEPVSFGAYSNDFTGTMVSNSALEKRLKFQFYTDERINDFSQINQLYLDRIIKLCASKEVELVFLNTPLHLNYRRGIPEVYIDKYDDLLSQYHMKAIDFSCLSLNDSCFVPDGDHVSRMGADITTKELLRIMQEQVGNVDF